MKKKLMVTTLIAAWSLSACSSEPAGAPLEAEPLHNLLLNASESGIDNAVEANDTSPSSQPIDLTVVLMGPWKSTVNAAKHSKPLKA